jgi:hypothetical protein
LLGVDLQPSAQPNILVVRLLGTVAEL